jgi:hypothetical protein
MIVMEGIRNKGGVVLMVEEKKKEEWVWERGRGRREKKGECKKTK